MLPVHYSASGLFGRTSPTVRNLIFVAIAAAGGIVIGGLSVLGIVVALIEPPNHDAPAGSAVFDGPHTVQAAPPVSAPAAAPTTVSAQPVAPVAPSPAPAPAQPVTPVDAQAMPPAQPQPQPVQPVQAQQQKAWPDALSARSQHAPDTAAAPAAPVQTASTPDAAAPAKVQTTSIGTSDSVDVVNSKAHSRPVNRSASTRIPAPQQIAPNAASTSRRVVIIQQNGQQVSSDSDDTSAGNGRPLFDFFGLFNDRHDGDAVDDASVQQPRARYSGNPRDPRLVIRQRRPDIVDDQSSENSDGEPHANWNNFFGYSHNDDWRN
jgi:hypothetical protein